MGVLSARLRLRNGSWRLRGFLTANLEAFAVVVNLQFTGNEQFTNDCPLDASLTDRCQKTCQCWFSVAVFVLNTDICCFSL